MNRFTRNLGGMLNEHRRIEENDLRGNSFVGRIAKGYKNCLVATSVFGIGIGCFLAFPMKSPAHGIIFAVIGVVSLLLLPTYFSYRCRVDKFTLQAEYYVLLFKVKKSVRWQDVKYKKVKREKDGNARSIRLYDGNKKKLIFFDNAIVGFEKIMRMAKNVPRIK